MKYLCPHRICLSLWNFSVLIEFLCPSCGISLTSWNICVIIEFFCPSCGISLSLWNISVLENFSAISVLIEYLCPYGISLSSFFWPMYKYVVGSSNFKKTKKNTHMYMHAHTHIRARAHTPHKHTHTHTQKKDPLLKKSEGEKIPF